MPPPDSNAANYDDEDLRFVAGLRHLLAESAAINAAGGASLPTSLLESIVRAAARTIRSRASHQRRRRPGPVEWRRSVLLPGDTGAGRVHCPCAPLHDRVSSRWASTGLPVTVRVWNSDLTAGRRLRRPPSTPRR